MSLKVIDDAFLRIEHFRQESDRDHFDGVMLLGELLIKLTTVFFVGCLDEDKQRSRYDVSHALVRADGIGRWVEILGTVLQGPISSNLVGASALFKSELILRHEPGSWQHESASAVREALRLVSAAVQPLESKVQLLSAFRDFASIRNATRGHGAYDSSRLREVAMLLEPALTLIARNLQLLSIEWVYLFQNLSEKYRVTNLGNGDVAFSDLRKKAPEQRYPDGVYIAVNGRRPLDLISYDFGGGTIFLPNGGFNGKRFETICYTTGDKNHVDGSSYLSPPGELPESDTAALKDLRVISDCLTNAPLSSLDYVERKVLEAELCKVLKDDRHLIVTLQGRGGIGKTSLALRVIDQLAADSRFGQICWFSARDIDLLPQGPKKVKADSITIDGFAELYTSSFSGSPQKGQAARLVLQAAMSRDSSEPSLLIFDNFETVTSPSEVFRWIDAYVRSPNKALITTRIREFNGDWAIDVGGMDSDEAASLALNLASSMSLERSPSQAELDEIYDESGGHPYVIRMMMGDFATTGKVRKIATLARTKEELLDALFERTFSQLSHGAVRVFLTCASWNSTIPVAFLEAVLLAEAGDAQFDVVRAVDELRLSSMVEVRQSSADQHEFVYVPLIAQNYAKSKLMLSPYRAAVEADLKILFRFGAYGIEDGTSSLTRRIEHFVSKVANDALTKPDSLEKSRTILEILAAQSPALWMTIARLEKEHSGAPDSLSRSREAVAKFIERSTDFKTPSDRQNLGAAWMEYFWLSDRLGDDDGKVNALLGMARSKGIGLSDLSRFANDFNRLLSSNQLRMDSVVKNSVTEALAEALAAAVTRETATAIDHSRLGWLYLRLARKDKALAEARKGLTLDPEDDYCLKLQERLL